MRVRHIECGIDSFSRWSYRRRLLQAAFANHGGGDLAAVEASVLDEDVGRIFTADYDACYVDSRTVGFECFGVYLGAPGFGIELNSLPLEEREIGMIAGHGEDLDGRDGGFVIGVLHQYLMRL